MLTNKMIFTFVARVIGWLVLMFSAWYALTPVFNRLLAWVLTGLLTGLFPHIFAGVTLEGAALDVATQLWWQQPGTPASQQGLLSFSVNPLIYGYGLPFFLALCLAVPEEHEIKPLPIGIGLVILFLVQLWGIGFDSFKTLLFSFGPDLAAKVSTSPLVITGVAYGYQLGTLILPVVVPVMLWLWIYQAYWQAWMGQETER